MRSRTPATLTKRRVLDGESDNVLHTLKGWIPIWPGKPFRNRDSNSSIRVPGIPGVLIKNFPMKLRETKVVLISVAVDVWNMDH